MTTLSEKYKAILDTRFREYRDAIRERMETNGQVATGKTKRSVVERTSSSGAKLVGAPYITTLRDGVRPGAFPPISAITEWMRAKGISGLNPYAVRTNLLKQGSRLHRGADPRFSKPTDTLNLDELKVAAEIARDINQANANEVKGVFADSEKIKIQVL